MDPDQRTMSRHLWEILDAIGLSPDVREAMVNTAITAEIIMTLDFQLTDCNTSAYRFGSSCEGTRTHGLQSDMDILVSVDDLPVIDTLCDAVRDGASLLLVTDSITPPGYVKLQFVVNEIPVTGDMYMHTDPCDYCSVDGDGRAVMNHTITSHSDAYTCERNGPANTRPDNGYGSHDIVQAYRCIKWPQCAKEYLNRTRHHNWPSYDQIEKMGTMGCFCVAVGHPDSPEKAFEWRISFSLQERELMLSLYPVQYKCYVMLKLIKKDIISEQLGDSITSYHCNTCLMYAIETTPSAFWVLDNLVECLLYCLNILSGWVADGVCPNYFIPDENMFDRRIHGELRDRLSTLLQDLLTENGRFLFRIRCDDVGYQLRSECCGITRQNYTRVVRSQTKDDSYIDVSMSIITSVDSLLKSVTANSSSTSCIQVHGNILAQLDSTITVTEHTKSQTREAIQYLIPFLHASLVSHLAVRLIQLTNGNTEGNNTEEMAKIRLAIDEQTMKGERIGIQIPSCLLKVAAIQYILGEYDRSERILSDVASAIHPFLTVNACPCKPELLAYNELLCDEISREQLSLADVLQTHVINCVKFLPTEMDVTPPALQYELFKSAGTPPTSRHDVFNEWYESSVADARVFLHYMQYMVYDKMGDIRQRRLAVENLETLTRTDDTLGHTETTYNLLGWIYKREGDINMATMCFVESLRVEPIHNAAKWHIGDLYLRVANTGYRCTTVAVIYT